MTQRSKSAMSAADGRPVSPASPSAAPYQRDATVPALFEEAAAEFPDRVAVASGVESLTYRQLRLRTDHYDAVLNGLGIGASARVGVVMHRSVDMVAALLATLKAGAAFVPLTPDQPVPRIKRLLTSVHVQALITDPEHCALYADCAPVVLTVEGASLTAGPGRSVPPREAWGTVTAGDPAYVMFTSGSTGTPKGVVVSHRNIVSLVREQSYARFRADETFLHLSTPAFDASTFEIWGALLSGARVVVAPPALEAFQDLPALLASHKVSSLFLTTPLFHQIADLYPDALDGVRNILVGGEPLSVGQARAIAARLPEGSSLANVYGPTETTTFASWYPVSRLTDGATSVPLGFPLAHTSMYVLDEHLNACPTGKTGEICVGGEGVSLGYYGEPELTEKRFILDPFSDVPGARMYRTGDLGRLLPDGAVEFLGRVDDQVKIRGFRVEPVEVEQELVNCSGVRDAAVVAVPQEDGTRRLAAYVVPASGEPLESPEQLRDLLRRRLPEYMVPQHVIQVDALPLTATGKLDRARLPSPNPAEFTSKDGSGGVPALTDTEAAMSELWQQILRIPRVMQDDDFFALGGDSLLVLRLVAAATELGMDISVAEVFRKPTIRELCAPDEAGQPPRSAPADAALPYSDLAALPAGTADAYPVTHMQLGMIYEAELSDDGSLYHDGISVTVMAPWDEEALRAAFATIGARHETLRTRFDLATFSEPVQIVESVARIPVGSSNLRGLSPREQAEALDARLAELIRPFDIECAPLIRAHASALDDESFQLQFAFHHAIMDGWSESVLLSEFTLAYEAARQDVVPRLPALGGARYRDLVAIERTAVHSPATREFWSARCSAMSPLLVAPGEAEPSSERVKTVQQVPEALCRSLISTARTFGAPLKNLLLAGHLAALGGLARRTDPVTGVVVNGRPETPGGDRLIGLFLNVLPVSATLEGTWRDLVNRSFAAEQDLLPHRWFPYAELHRMVGSHLFDVAFNYVRFHMYAELEQHSAVRLREQQIHDKASVPCMVDIAHDPSTDSLLLEFSADASAWTASSLEEMAETYLRLYGSLVADPLGPVTVGAADAGRRL